MFLSVAIATAMALLVAAAPARAQDPEDPSDRAGQSEDQAEVDPPDDPKASGRESRTYQAPIGGRPFTLEEGAVICGQVPPPWRAMPGGRSLMPPSQAEAIGKPVEIEVAARSSGCGKADSGKAVLIATGPLPSIEAGSIVLSPDEGRVDARGGDLKGVQLYWRSGKRSGKDTCQQPGASPSGGQQCAWSIERKVKASPKGTSLRFLPAGARVGDAVVTYDERGRSIDASELSYYPASIVLQRLLRADASVDLSTGIGEIELPRPEAVGRVECDPLDCELKDGRVLMRGSRALVDRVTIRLHARPRVTVRAGEGSATHVTEKVAVLHCPMKLVSGEPFAHTESAAAAVQLRGACARDVPDLEFRYEHRRLKVLATAQSEDATFVLLRLGHVPGDSVTITALRGGASPVVVAVADSPTRRLPPPRVSLEVPGHPNLDFIPVNRWARVRAASRLAKERLVPLPVPGVYKVRHAEDASYVRADPAAAGMSSLRLAVRNPELPSHLAKADLAVVDDPLMRGVRAANTPVAIAGKKPLVELICREQDDGKPRSLPMGETVKLEYGVRDTCRLVFHRERIRARDGAQRIRIEIDVYRADGGTRGDAHVSETLTLRPDQAPRVSWVHGVQGQFDRLAVRISHDAESDHYLGSGELISGLPAAKWTVIFGSGRLRLYATTAFPTGLYRLSDSDHSGVLSLNFGLLSRLTWLDDEGHEGFLSLESGLVVVGLGNAVSDSGGDLSQVGAVVGLGLSVPFANRSTSAQASLNVHAWLEVDLTYDDSSGSDGRFAFIFGPSLSIGNIGTNL